MNLLRTFALLAILPFRVTSSSDGHPPGLQKIPITCDAGTFNNGQNAEITCNFHRQMDQDKRGISVVRHSLNASANDTGTDILLCQWKEKVYDCWTEQNYKFDGVITDRLTLEIPTVSKEFGGLYFCFIVPSEDTQKHACTLKIKGVPVASKPGGNGTDLQPTKEKTHAAWIVLGIVLAILLVGAVCTYCCYRRLTKNENNNEHAPEAVPLFDLNHHVLEQEERTSNNTLKELLAPFELSTSDYKRMSKHLHQRIAEDPCKVDKLHKHSVCVPRLPKGTEKGGFLSVGIGANCVEVQYVHLSGACTEPQCAATYNPLKEGKALTGTANTMEDTIYFRVANVVAKFLKSCDLYRNVLPVEFVMNCPDRVDNEVTMQRLNENLPDLMQLNICQDEDSRDPTVSQQAAFRRKKATQGLKIKPTVKDPAGTLLSGVYHDPTCSVSFLPEVEFTACYTAVSAKNTEKQEIITVHFGAFGEKGSFDVFRTDFDNELDASSANPGKKILEKMVSWNHLGEILRLVMLELSEKEVLSTPIPGESALHTTGGLTAKQASLIESDLNGQNRLTQLVLDVLSLKNCTDDDCNIVREAFKCILERSACLAATALAALITHLGQPGVTIAVDGFMYRYHPYFYEVMKNMTMDLVHEKLKGFKLSPQFHGRRVGAAVAAVLSGQTASASSEHQP